MCALEVWLEIGMVAAFLLLIFGTWYDKLGKRRGHGRDVGFTVMVAMGVPIFFILNACG